MSARPVAVKLDGDTITCRTIIPDNLWGDTRRREAVWDELLAACEQEAVRREAEFSGEPPQRVARHIRFLFEDGALKCDTGATEWTATDVWLQLTVKTGQPAGEAPGPASP